MSNTNEQIEAILARYGEPTAGNVWQAEAETFVHHRTLERIAGKANIIFDPPAVLRAERDEAVLLVIGRMGERMEWSIGEALVGVNYHVPGSEPAYVYAMAEKRGKDRVILKLIDLPDVVSSAEPHAVERPPSSSNENTPTSQSGSESGLVGELKRNLDWTETVEAVIALMRSAETQQSLGQLAPEQRDEVRAYAKDRLVALGWAPKQAA
jgi:hypothetical protein